MIQPDDSLAPPDSDPPDHADVPSMSGTAAIQFGRDATITDSTITITQTTVNQVVSPPAGAQDDPAASYLNTVRVRLGSLPFTGILGPQPPAFTVADVYIPLLSEHRRVAATGLRSDLDPYFDSHDRHRLAATADPDTAHPHQAILHMESGGVRVEPRSLRPDHSVTLFHGRDVLEALPESRCVFIQGDAGCGKSTLLRMLTWSCAAAATGIPQALAPIAAWLQTRRPIPILIRAVDLAAQLAAQPKTADTVLHALVAELDTHFRLAQPYDLLTMALSTGRLLILLDGLDEVPADRSPTLAGRQDVMQAVTAFQHHHPTARCVVTSRPQVWTASDHGRDPRPDALIPAPWVPVTIQPLQRGQARLLIQQWYAALIRDADRRDAATREQATSEAAEQHARIAGLLHPDRTLRPRFRHPASFDDLFRTPLLITLILGVVRQHRQLPRDRSYLYDTIYRMLFAEWDRQKTNTGGVLPLDVAHIPSDVIRATMDHCAYDALCAQRETIPITVLREALEAVGHQHAIAHPRDTAAQTLAFFQDRASLLLPASNTTVQFPHRTFLEYSAGRHLLEHEPLPQVMAAAADPRWHHAIVLGIGSLDENPHATSHLETVLRRLLERHDVDGRKPRALWHRHLLLVGRIVEELGWETLKARGILSSDVQALLQTGLVAVLTTAKHPASVLERTHAGVKHSAPRSGAVNICSPFNP